MVFGYWPFFQIKVLNDSKEVAITLYITSIILAAVIIITVVFDEYQNVYSATYSLGIPLSSSVVLGVVYISKVRMVWAKIQAVSYLVIYTIS